MMREGRWREIDRGEQPAEFVRCEQQTPDGQCRHGRGHDGEHHGEPVSTVSTAATAYRYGDLDDADDQQPVCGDPHHRHNGPCEVYAPAEQHHGEPVSTVSTAATAYRYGDLDDADRARMDALFVTFGIDRAAVRNLFHVGRTRRGFVIMLTEWEVDENGDPVVVLGEPVVRHHLQPVGADELPVACRKGGVR